MGDIRRQSIASSLLIYIGFAVGGLNIYLMVRAGLFTPDQKGLIDSITALNLVFYSFANIGATAIMSRFFPLYHQYQSDQEDDLLSVAFGFALIGFVLTLIGAYAMEPIFIRKFSAKSPELLRYYYWILPYTFFYLIFMILETQAGINKKTLLANFMKETGSRVWLTLLIVLYALQWIQFDWFVKLFMFSYAIGVLVLGWYLHQIGKLTLSFRFSTLTRRLSRRMFQLAAYVFLGNIVFNVAQNIDSITITSQLGMSLTAVYMLSKYISSIVSVPMRSMVSIAVPYLSQAWKAKNYTEVARIYKRSAINLFIVGLFLFLNIWLNLDQAYEVFQIDPSYEAGKWLVLILGIGMLVDLSTGINGHMLYVSPIWRFEFWSGLIVMLLTIPANYFLVKQYGTFGAAWVNLGMMVLTNAIRTSYVYYRYGMQPYSMKTLYALLAALLCYGITWWFLDGVAGWLGLLLRSTLFSVLFLSIVYMAKLTPDWAPVVEAFQKRLKRK
jgi:O-antigen/teichoic acid export membrane protein